MGEWKAYRAAVFVLVAAALHFLATITLIVTGQLFKVEAYEPPCPDVVVDFANFNACPG